MLLLDKSGAGLISGGILSKSRILAAPEILRGIEVWLGVVFGWPHSIDY